MADNLPDPESRVESYLAKAAGEDVTIPEKPLSRLEQYLDAIAEGGGGGGTSDFDQLSNRPKYNGTAMTGETNIPASPTVVQDIGTSTTDVMSQDATTGLVYAKTTSKNLIRIGYGATTSTKTGDSSISIGTSAKSLKYSTIALGVQSRAEKDYNIAIGTFAQAYNGTNEIAIGYNSGSATSGSTRNISIGGSARAASTDSVAIGYGAIAEYATSAVALGAGAKATQKGQFDISAGTSGTNGYNNSQYRLLTGLYDPQNAHDAATKGYVDGLVGDIESALNTINNGGN